VLCTIGALRAGLEKDSMNIMHNIHNVKVVLYNVSDPVD
jgi:hypothetical protein